MTINPLGGAQFKNDCIKGFTPWVWKCLGRTSVSKHSSSVETQIQVKTTALPQASQTPLSLSSGKKRTCRVPSFQLHCYYGRGRVLGGRGEKKLLTGAKFKGQRLEELETTHMCNNNMTFSSGTSQNKAWAQFAQLNMMSRPSLTAVERDVEQMLKIFCHLSVVIDSLFAAGMYSQVNKYC